MHISLGKRVFVIIGNNKINMSPLRGLDDSVFIYDISKFIKYEENFLLGQLKIFKQTYRLMIFISLIALILVGTGN